MPFFNEQRMKRELKQALLNAKLKLIDEYKLDEGLSAEKQTERLLELESELMSQELNRVFYTWLTDLERELKGENNL